MNSDKNSLRYIYLYIFMIFFTQISGCGVYSFSGTSIPESVKTFCVYYIKNNAPLVQPNLSNNLTEELKTKWRTISQKSCHFY